MSIVKDLAILQYLTNTLITQKGVGEALNFSKGAINNRIIRGGGGVRLKYLKWILSIQNSTSCFL